MRDIIEKLDEANARIERIIFIAGAMASGYALSDDLNEFLDDEDEVTIEICLGAIPDYVDLDGRRSGRGDGIFEWLTAAGKLGFLVKFATPVMEPSGKESCSFSWGYYHIGWIYADTIEQAISGGLCWVEQQHRADAEPKTKKGGE